MWFGCGNSANARESRAKGKWGQEKQIVDDYGFIDIRRYWRPSRAEAKAIIVTKSPSLTLRDGAGRVPIRLDGPDDTVRRYVQLLVRVLKQCVATGTAASESHATSKRRAL
ncbi:hypothetical protein E4U31_001219 [Claviceps sp. LM219 group G6]|nr:hypothetical protein E4U31_001219 [Claviceps sp. LM219 group G6]